MNKYENPIDTIGVEPSGTEVNIPHLYDNATFTAVLNKTSSERKSAKEKILSGETPMPDFDSIQRKQTQMQEPNSRPFQSANTEIRYNEGTGVEHLKIFQNRTDDFAVDETIEGVAIRVDSENSGLSPFNGIYLKKGPTTHSNLLSAVRCNTDIKLPMYHDNFADREYIHGFYTNKGNFITRRQARWLIEENNLPTAVHISEISGMDGCLSTDIWNEDGSPSSHRVNPIVNATSDRFTIATPTGLGHISDIPPQRQRDSKGKTIPKSASEMMAEKRLKKMMKRYGQN